MKRVILTGGTGFVGANLARRLLQDGHELHLLVRPEHADWRIAAIRDDVRLHAVDLRDAEDVERVVGDVRPEWIFHLAAHGAYSYQTDLRRIFETNLTGTVNLVQASLQSGFEAFVNTGSSSEYGFKDFAPSEDDRLDPNSSYAVAKASATLFCRFAAQSRGVHLPTLRLYSVYGPFEEPTRLIPTLIMRGFEGRFPPLVNPDVARDYVYVDDVCDAYLLAASLPQEEPGAIYNVGTGVQTTLRGVVQVARRALAIQVEPEWGSMQDRRWDTRIWVADNRKIQQVLGWGARHLLEDGFQLTVDWLQANPALRETYALMQA